MAGAIFNDYGLTLSSQDVDAARSALGGVDWSSRPHGVLKFKTSDGVTNWLLITHRASDHMFSVGFQVEGPLPSLSFAINNPQEMERFDLVEGATLPMGSFLPFERAVDVMVRFIAEPTLRPDIIAWIDSNQLPWPPDDSY